eukprot:924660-Pyramimonas_sp.AAC.1
MRDGIPILAGPSISRRSTINGIEDRILGEQREWHGFLMFLRGFADLRNATFAPSRDTLRSGLQPQPAEGPQSQPRSDPEQPEHDLPSMEGAPDQGLDDADDQTAYATTPCTS